MTVAIRERVANRANRRATARTGSKWTPEADHQLMQARTADMGWDAIANTFFTPGTTGNACRKRHERLMNALKCEEWNGPRHAELMLLYSKHRELMWTRFAQSVSESSGRPVRWTTLEKQMLGAAYRSTMRTLRAAERGSSSGEPDDEASEDEDEAVEDAMTPSSTTMSTVSPSPVLSVAPLAGDTNEEAKNIRLIDGDRNTPSAHRGSCMPLSFILAPKEEESPTKAKL